MMKNKRLRSILGFLRFSFNNHLLLDTVRILEISLIAVGILGANHILLSLLLVLLLRAFLSDLLKIVD
jgi:hypothetical protein